MKRLTKVRSFLILMLICTILLGLAPAGTPKAAEQSSEVVSLREENVKHFKVGENSYEAIAYSHPVHEKDENGVWQDIDFGMSYTKTRGLATYQNKTAGVEFSATYTKNQPLMSIANDDVSISMTPIAAPFTSGKAVNGQVVSTSAAKVTNPKSKFLTIEDAESATFSSTLLYENILENVDLEYTVSYSSVNKKIITKQASNEYIYYFNLELDSLYPKIHNDGSILFYQSKTNNLKYVMPAPFMYDGSGNLSEDVSYTIEPTTDGTYLLTIAADASWINKNDRSFPITVNSTTNDTTRLILDTYVNSDEPTRNYGYSQYLCVRHNRIPLLYFDPIPLPDNARLEEATLHMYYFYYDYVQSGYVSTSTHKFTAHNWNYSNIAWQDIANLPNYGFDNSSMSTKTAYAGLEATASNPRKITFDITPAVNSWREGSSSNYGIGLLYETTSTNLSVLFYSSDSQVGYSPSVKYSYLIPETIYTFNSYYDESFSDYTDIIPEAIDFVDLVFRASFGIGFTEGYSQTENFAGNYHPQDYVSCDQPNCYTVHSEKYTPCLDSACDKVHHKDAYGISSYYLQNITNEKEVIILWTALENNIYCEHIPIVLGGSGFCKVYNEEPCPPFAVVFDYRPVIQFLRADTEQEEIEGQTKSFSLLLLHETAHTLGLPEQYGDDNPSHPTNCIMHYYNVDDVEDLYEAILEHPETAFCQSCKDLLLQDICSLS